MTKRNVFVYGFRQFMAILMVCWLFLAPAASAATDRVAIPADSCGPGVALKDAGYSYRLVPQLQHEDGSPLLATEVRTASDKVFYLPVGAQPDSAKYAEFISAENGKFGIAQGPCIVKGPGCKELLLAANKRADELNAALGVANKRAEQAEASVANLTKKLAVVKAALKTAQDNEGISPWWLLLLLFVPAVWLWMRWSHLQVEEDRKQQLNDMPKDIEEAAQQRDAAIAQAERAEDQRDAANEQIKSLQEELRQKETDARSLREQLEFASQSADSAERARQALESDLAEERDRSVDLQKHLEAMIKRWNNAETLRARIAELEVPPAAEAEPES